MAKKSKYRFSGKFLMDFFNGRNIITRKSDGYWWRVDLSNWLLHDDKGYQFMTDEVLAQFFNEDNEFKFDEYELSYRDFFKEWQQKELRENGARLLNEIAESERFNDTTELVMRRIIGVKFES